MNKFSLLAIVAGLAACAAAQSFAPAGNLQLARANAAAVLLPNGNVLVVGGEDAGQKALASAEIYSPAHGAFTATGSLATARWGPQAMLLSNGKVLVVGGQSSPIAAATTAELYDPSAGMFSAAPALPVALSNPEAVLLADGRVFISGEVAGCDGASGACTDPVVIYDPIANTFTAGGQLEFARTEFATALLANGKVLVVAGFPANGMSSGPIGSAEIYDPSSGTSQMTGSLVSPAPAAAIQTATLLPGGTVLVCGGNALGYSALPFCETYDPTAGQFTPTGSMADARVWDTATPLSDGTVLVAAGLGGAFGAPAQALASAAIYTPSLRSFAATGSLATARSNAAAVRIASGAILIAGGYSGANGDVLASAELYTPASAPPADFSVTASTGQIDLTNQTTAQFGLTANGVNGFSGAITLACTDAGGATCSFDPATLNAGESGTLTVADLGGVDENVLSFNLTATSGATTHTLPLRITFSPTAAPASLTFAATAVGGNASPQSVTLTSAASGVKFVSVAATGDFSLGGNTCWQGLDDGADCSLPVSFTPTASGTRAGTLTATDAAGDPPLQVTLTGTGVAPTPTLAMDPDALSFPSQLLNSSSAAQIVTFTNSGTAALSVSGVTITGDFAQTNTCGSSLAAGKSCTVAVVFTPTANGNRSGTLAIADNASGSPQDVTLTGLGTTPAPSLQMAPGSLSFSSQLLTTPSAAQTVTLTNSGTAALSVSAIAATGDFAQTNTCGSSLAAGKTCTIAVVFTPTTSGSRTGSLNLTDNAAASPQQLALTGTGADLSLAGTSGSATSTSITAGQTATFSVAVQGMGGFTGAVALACTGAPAMATCSVNPGSLNATSAATAVTVSVATVASSDAPPIPSSYPAPPLWLVPLLGLFAFLLTVKLRLRTAAFAGLAGLGLLLAGCGGSMAPAQSMTQPGTAAGSYTLTLTATSGSLTRTVPLSLQVH